MKLNGKFWTWLLKQEARAQLMLRHTVFSVIQPSGAVEECYHTSSLDFHFVPRADTGGGGGGGGEMFQLCCVTLAMLAVRQLSNWLMATHSRMHTHTQTHTHTHARSERGNSIT